MRYNRKRPITALEREGIHLTKAELDVLDKLWVWMADQMVKIYLVMKKDLQLHWDDRRRAALERKRTGDKR